jgi:hypothetical protein
VVDRFEVGEACAGQVDHWDAFPWDQQCAHCESSESNRLTLPSCAESLRIAQLRELLGFSDRTKLALRSHIELRFWPFSWDQLRLDSIARHLDTPACIIHDEEDTEELYPRAARVATAWNNAQFIRTGC